MIVSRWEVQEHTTDEIEFPVTLSDSVLLIRPLLAVR